jgi:hypothetical protein
VIARAVLRRRLPPRVVLITVSALAAAALAACSGGGSATQTSASAAAPSLPTPLARSLQSAAGTWATVPMGHLDQPLNTFWQLFFRPAGGASWSNQVQATATATNGGLILADDHGGAVIVGVRPTDLLTYSPLISTADGGRSWSTGLVSEGLLARPDSLAANSPSQALALANGRGGAEVLASADGLSGWRTASTARALAATAAGRTCALAAITAVAYLAADPLVGASCARPGMIGVFVEHAGSWQLLAATAPSSLARARVEVLALQSADGGAQALLGVSAGGASDLVAAWYEHGQWLSSRPLAVGASERVSSYGPATGSGIFALLTGASGAKRLAVASAPGAAWQQLTPPPAGTATIAFAGGSSVDALAVHDTVLTVWGLAPSAHTWTRRQTIDVPIEFGSSE